jgi:hypothetical protein
MRSLTLLYHGRLFHCSIGGNSRQPALPYVQLAFLFAKVIVYYDVLLDASKDNYNSILFAERGKKRGRKRKKARGTFVVFVSCSTEVGKGFFMLWQTHFFTPDWYSQDKESSQRNAVERV